MSIHATNNAMVRNNVAFMIRGNGFYLETGKEEFNTFDRNMVAYVIPIAPLGGVGQAGDTRVEVGAPLGQSLVVLALIL